ncbi:MAG TPA: acyl-CoA dehydrogenase family protein [Thermoanaerobaculia bacterium]|nr:acyl-CoA dehydrogenase family protein [Thermoanaerobaculia bacterium]
MAFFQDGPELGNTWAGDRALRECVRRLLPSEVLAEVEPDLERLGERAAGEMLALAVEAERDPPRLVRLDAWGRRVDRIETCPAWRRLHEIAAEEGVVAIAYERAHGEHSRVHQFARLALYHPSSAFASCPLAMTDGAARTLEIHGEEELRERILPRLISRDPEAFWTAGQWMTERTGGSDVGDSETVAAPDGAGGWRLTGSKWFTSATTAEVALTLARCEGAPAGSRGLSMFFLETGMAAGALRGIRVERLKDKLGTRALPTAELELDGVPARMVGEPGRGVPTIATVLNITRLYNACCAAGTLGRGLALARDYARRRRAFGRPLAELPLHLETLAGLAAEHAAALQLTFRAAQLLGREECGVASAGERELLRLATPLVKLTTGRQVVAGVSEVVECFGGAGYVEDTGLPGLLRDAQVFPIWEGTTNVLALDALRAARGGGALAALEREISGAVEGSGVALLAPARSAVRECLAQLVAWHSLASRDAREALEAGARDFSLGLGRTWAASLLLSQAEWEARGSERAAAPAVEAARRFAATLGAIPVPRAASPGAGATRDLALGGAAEEVRAPALR